MKSCCLASKIKIISISLVALGNTDYIYWEIAVLMADGFNDIEAGDACDENGLY